MKVLESISEKYSKNFLEISLTAIVQEPSPDRDPKCERANGVFNHYDENVCDKYIQCDDGRAFELPCPVPLVFDTLVGSCVRKEQASEEARRCDGEKVFEIDGFKCPGGETFGPQNLLQAHPIYAHPTDCRSYFSCYHNKVSVSNILLILI